MFRTTTLAFVLCAIWTSFCQADMVIEGDFGNAQLIVSDPVPVGDGSEQLQKVVLSLVPIGGGFVNGFEGGFTGKFHQQAIESFGTQVSSATLDEPFPGSTAQTMIDTHFRIMLATVIAPTPPGPPDEDINVSPSTEAPDVSGPAAAGGMVSFGSYLNGTFSVSNGNETNPFELAQIVVPINEVVTYDFDAAVANGSILTDSFDGNFTVVPEPSSMICLTLVSLICGVRVGYKRFFKKVG